MDDTWGCGEGEHDGAKNKTRHGNAGTRQKKPHRQVHNKDLEEENVQRKRRMHSIKLPKSKNTSGDAKLEMEEETGGKQQKPTDA